MGTMQIKRGTTASWKLGPELVNFENLSIKTKDSVISYEKNSIKVQLWAPSMNYPGASKTKVAGIPLVDTGEITLGQGDFLVRASVRSLVGDMNDRQWSLDVYHSYEDPNNEERETVVGSGKPTGSVTIRTADHLQLFLSWDDQSPPPGPIEVEITLSIREDDASSDSRRVSDTLLPGQLGCELDASGNTLLKVGPHNVGGNPTQWHNIPYVGQVLPQCMYGDSADRERDNPAPRKGQVYFLESQTTPGAYWITIHNGSQWSDEAAST